MENNYQLIFLPKYFEDIERHKKTGKKKLIEKILILLEEIQKHPTTGTGKT